MGSRLGKLSVRVSPVIKRAQPGFETVILNLSKEFYNPCVLHGFGESEDMH